MSNALPLMAPALQSRRLAEVAESILLLHVTGEDKPGITASLTRILGRQQVEILDINQTVIHKTLLLGMLVRIPPEVGAVNGGMGTPCSKGCCGNGQN